MISFLVSYNTLLLTIQLLRTIEAIIIENSREYVSQINDKNISISKPKAYLTIKKILKVPHKFRWIALNSDVGRSNIL